MDPITMALIGGAIGGLTSKKPLKGALMGAAAGATGGALMGGAAGGGGLLSQMGTAAANGTAIGSQQTAMLAAQEAGMGGGLLSSMKAAAPTAQAAMQGIQTAQSLMPQQQPIQAAPLQGGSFDASGLLSANNQQLQALQQKRQQRRGGV